MSPTRVIVSPIAYSGASKSKLTVLALADEPTMRDAKPNADTNCLCRENMSVTESGTRRRNACGLFNYIRKSTLNVRSGSHIRAPLQFSKLVSNLAVQFEAHGASVHRSASSKLLLCLDPAT